jgi:GAF domain-containing protein
VVQARVLGVLTVGTAERHHFSAQDVQLLKRAAERIAVAIERAQLYERVQVSEARLRQVIDASLIGIAVGEGCLALHTAYLAQAPRGQLHSLLHAFREPGSGLSDDIQQVVQRERFGYDWYPQRVQELPVLGRQHVPQGRQQHKRMTL